MQLCRFVVVVVVVVVVTCYYVESRRDGKKHLLFFVVIVVTHNAARVLRATRTRLRDVNERFLRTISTTVYVRRKPTSFFCLTSSPHKIHIIIVIKIKRLNGHDDDTTRSQYNVYINIYIFQNKRNFNNHVWNWFLLPSSKAI